MLGVASVWDARKGLADFVELSALLDERFQIVLVGLRENQRKGLPGNILALPRTATVEELAEILYCGRMSLSIPAPRRPSA